MRAYLDVGQQQLGSRRSGQWEGVRHFGASARLAEMPIANSREADRVGFRACDKTFEFLDQGNGRSIDVWADALASFDRYNCWGCSGYRKKSDSQGEEGLKMHVDNQLWAKEGLRQMLEF
jgi:hypothetical protein